MSTTREQSGQVSEEHRETLERAKRAIYDSGGAEEEFDSTLSAFEAAQQLAEVSLELWEMAVTAEGSETTEIGDGELPFTTVRRIAPMKPKVAFAILEHADRLVAVREQTMERAHGLEEATQDLARELTGYEEGFPVLQALKELDLGG